MYPLKFLWSLFFLGLANRAAVDMLPHDRAWVLFVVYGAGVAAMFAILAALYGHAYRRRDVLRLTPAEIVDTRVDVYRNLAFVGIGLLSVVVAIVASTYVPRLAGVAGYVYFLVGVSEWTLGAYNGRLRRQLAAE